jgi:molybdate transport system regulatory protein
MYTLKVKVWLERDGKFLISDGRASLLQLILETKSLKKAAGEMGMSYRHAWGVLRRINDAAGGRVVESKRGGNFRESTVLTPLGKEILDEYKRKAAKAKRHF